MSATHISAPDAPAAIGPYSHAVVAERETVFLSGQTPIDPSTGLLVNGDFSDQVRQVFANLRSVLTATELTVADVVKVNVYLTDMADFDEMNQIYGDIFSAPYPSRTTVQVAGLPLGARIEVELTATVSEAS